MAHLGIKQVKASAYHPQALEKFHETLKTMMKSYLPAGEERLG